MGLREEKKQQTRRRIADSAWTMFADRGFETVTVTQIATAAEVSEATVYNYFATKDDLFFYRLDEYGDTVVAAIAGRAPGESVLAAFRRVLLAPRGLVGQIADGDQRALDRLRTVNRVIADSPALQVREQRSLQRTAQAMADLLVAEAGPDLSAQSRTRAFVTAHALMVVQHALVIAVREVVLAGDIPDDFAAEVARLGEAAFSLLEGGLG